MNFNTAEIIKKVDKFEIFFRWLRLFYTKSKGIPFLYLLYFFIPQKIFRINGCVPWPVHFTSRILYWQNIEMGNGSALGMSGGCYIQARNGIIVGHNVRIGHNVGLISANHDLDNYDVWPESPPIRIGNNVWIAKNVVILPGVIIGDNVVIGANSTVTKNIPSDSVAFGSPCKVIRKKSPYKGRDYSKI